MPTKEQVASKVKEELASKAGIQPSAVVETKKLTEWPLTLDSIALGFIAITLRKYIKSINSGSTITAQELRKKDLKVSALIDLVYLKLQKV